MVHAMVPCVTAIMRHRQTSSADDPINRRICFSTTPLVICIQLNALSIDSQSQYANGNPWVTEFRYRSGAILTAPKLSQKLSPVNFLRAHKQHTVRRPSSGCSSVRHEATCTCATQPWVLWWIPSRPRSRRRQCLLSSSPVSGLASRSSRCAPHSGLLSSDLFLAPDLLISQRLRHSSLCDCVA